MKKMTKRQSQAAKTKLKIVELSMELFRDQGFENVKIADICQKANISVGAFYHHFPSKNEIIDEGYKQVDVLIQEKFNDCEFSSGLEALDYFYTVSGEIMTDFGWPFMVESYKNILSRHGVYTFSRERFVYQYILQSIDKAKHQGEISLDTSSEALAESVIRLSRGIIFDWCIHQGNYNLGDLMVLEMRRYLLGGRL